MGFQGVIEQASNIRTGSSYEITRAEFFAIYPQFNTETIPVAFVDMILSSANAIISEARWHSMRKLGVCLFTAHYCTMFAKSNDTTGSTGGAEGVATGGSHGDISSVSVDGLSVSYQDAKAVQDLTGFGSYKDSVYGQQLATLSKMVTGGMMIVP